MSERLGILQHSLGLDKYGHGEQYRSHFVTGPGSSDFAVCVSLVADGLMTQRSSGLLAPGQQVFNVTRKGIDYVALNSPVRPPEPKLTRSKQRYRDFLHADSGLSFREWLGIRTPEQKKRYEFARAYGNY